MDEWTRPDPSRMALLTIDVQREFQPGSPSGRLENAMAVPAASMVARAFREAAIPIVHIVRLYLPDASNADLCRRSRILSGDPLLVPGSDSSQIAPQLLPDPSIRLDHELLLSGSIQRIGPAESIIYKPRFGAFFQTPLNELLNNLGINTLVITGSNYPNCPRATIFEASERDFRIAAVRDAISLLEDSGVRELEAIGVLCIDSPEAVSLVFRGV
ncbi:MAG: isochorismatase family cysteine hydrolase [Thermovirgaceae bacterium]|nr:isochorismatase family cysteine hydrolase [Thermovirgaceae bacterium]